MDTQMEDEKKPFDAEVAQEDDSQPDPDESLMLDQGNGRVWLVKIPKFLMERWANINVEDMHLATLRVYQPPPDKPHQKARIVLFLPPNRDPNDPNAPVPPQQEHPNRPVFDTYTSFTTNGPEPTCYELDMVNESVDNQIVVAERPKDPPPTNSNGAAPAPVNTRARTTILTGRIKHECNLRPAFDANYRRQMKERHRKYNTPVRQIKMIDPSGVPGGRGGVNRLSSGVGMGAGNAFSDFVKTKPKQAKGTFERMARIPYNQLLDLLFPLFKENPRWGIRPLRQRTQQPEAYLKETLQGIAFLHKSGEYNGLWELTNEFKDKADQADLPPPALTNMDDVKSEEDDDDEDDDMEEVS
ncbi:hypothetical protein D9613_012434 [Agrocybe pediades]|uniref:Transcription initiation factor IIF subunit beta n=1 Tax=Agrocybe pediades TaxID=84607 RepID=A0A8H4VMX9_9AGAR|nr:hypothetical protein D9613_012434 [Agrocybe pediades]